MCSEIVVILVGLLLHTFLLNQHTLYDLILFYFIAIVWQLMRSYTLAMLQKLSGSDKPIEEDAIIMWTNTTVSNLYTTPTKYHTPLSFFMVTQSASRLLSLMLEVYIYIYIYIYNLNQTWQYRCTFFVCYIM